MLTMARLRLVLAATALCMLFSSVAFGSASANSTIALSVAQAPASLDCSIRSGPLADNSFCNADVLKISAQNDRLSRALVNFSLAGVLPDDAYVIEAKAGICLSGGMKSSAAAIAAHELEQSFNGAATWNRYDGANTWALAGGDYAPTATDTAAVDQHPSWYWWNLKPATVRGWIDGTVQQRGLLFKLAPEVSHAANLVFRSAEGPVEYRPRLELGYLVDSAAPDIFLGGALFDAADKWLGGGFADLQIEAIDGTADVPGSGVRSIEVLVDGARAAFVDQPCDQGYCQLALDFAFPTADYGDGEHTIKVVADDQLGHKTQETWTVGVDRGGPEIDLSGSLVENDGDALEPGSYDLNVAATDGTAAAPRSGVKSIEILVDEERKAFQEQPCPAGNCPLDLAFTLDTADYEEGAHLLRVVSLDQIGNQSDRTLDFAIEGDTSVPHAPPLDKTVITPFSDATSFLYTGRNPIQKGVDAGAIDEVRASVIRGFVKNRAGEPLSGARVTADGHDEFGYTETLVDGSFFLAVNGGGEVVVRFEKDGYLPSERQVKALWQDYAWLADDVVLVPLDDRVTSIDLSSPDVGMQVARGSRVSDGDGSRQATLLFPAGTTAEMTLGNGSAVPLETLHVRATEYTVGSTGPQAMPAELPPTSGYTYAVDYSVDEAFAANAKSVSFSKSVIGYVENFLGFPVGETVPVGYYDSERNTWVPSDNGRVVKILSIAGGRAALDVKGGGNPASAADLQNLGITNAELERLAELYVSGETLWRVSVDHFSPWDYNWPYGFPPGAIPPNALDLSLGYSPEDDPCEEGGSIIECENQVLAEQIPIAGTPFSLRYQSDRTPGRLDSNVVQVQVSGGQVPANLKRIDVSINLAGRTFRQSVPSSANQRVSFTWDGKDAFGRTLQGRQPMMVRVDYVYPGVQYRSSGEFERSFAQFSDKSIVLGTSRIENEVKLTRTKSGSLSSSVGIWDARAQGFGGWTLSAQHSYDSTGHVLNYGDGRRDADTENVNPTTGKFAGYGQWPGPGDGGQAIDAILIGTTKIHVTPDNNVYILESPPGSGRIRRVDSDGVITTTAGKNAGDDLTGDEPIGDGGPATDAVLYNAEDFAVAPDGSIYIADSYHARIRKVTPQGLIETIAGGAAGDGCNNPTIEEGVQATSVALCDPLSVAIDRDGNVYFGDTFEKPGGSRGIIRKVDLDGKIRTVVGLGNNDGEDVFVEDASVGFRVDDIEIGPDGALYYRDGRTRRIGPDGIVRTVAGGKVWPSCTGDGGPAIDACFSDVRDIAFDRDGSLIILESNGLRHVNAAGIITTIYKGRYLQGIGVAPNGDFYISTAAGGYVNRITPSLPGFEASDLTVASEDGDAVYVFNDEGRHLRTLNALTGAVELSFSYNDAGVLTGVTNAYDDTTRIERDSEGQPTAIIAPFGQRTELETNRNGYLSSVVNTTGESVALQTSESGLLEKFTDAREHESRFTYDSSGRLVKDENAAGGVKVLARSGDSEDLYEVTTTTGLGFVTKHGATKLTSGDRVRKATGASGISGNTTISLDGTRTLASPDGTSVSAIPSGDPRFGMQSPYPGTFTIKTPSGRSAKATRSRYVSLVDYHDPLSISSASSSVSVSGRYYQGSFDGATKRFTSTSPEGRKVYTNIDDLGQVVKQEVAGFEPIVLSYDTHGRLSVVKQGPREWHYGYGTNGYLESITNPLGRAEHFSYDEIGLLTGQTLADGRSIGYEYDDAGNLTSITPPSRSQSLFTYSPVDLVTSLTLPDAGNGETETRYSWDADGEIAEITRPDGSAISFDYDLGRRLSTIAWPDGQTNYEYGDTTGKLTGMRGPGSAAITFEYDGPLALAQTFSGPVPGRVNWTYDTSFRVASEAVNGSQINYTYDRDSLLKAAGNLTLARSASSGLLEKATLGAMKTSFVNDTYGQQASVNTAFNTEPLLGFTYTRDELGRITAKAEDAVSGNRFFSYRYDEADRLAEVKEGDRVVESYSYDANGSRTSVTTRDDVTLSATFDAQDRLKSFGTHTYSYSKNGDLETAADSATGETTSYDYDSLGVLRAVTIPDGKQIDYLTDPLGRRIGKKVNGSLVQGFVYGEELGPIAELNPDGSLKSRFVYGISTVVPDYMIRGGKTYRIVSDERVSPRIVVDASSGEIVQELDYDSYGRVTRDTNPGFQPFGFAGGLYDSDTGLAHFGAREYDAETGRFTSPDPVDFSGGDTNLYAYVTGDPINFFDPTGLGLSDIWTSPASVDT